MVKIAVSEEFFTKIPTWLSSLEGTSKGNLIEDILNQEFAREAFKFFRLYAASIEKGETPELPEDKKEFTLRAIEQISPRAAYLKKQELDALITIYEQNSAEAATKRLAEKAVEEKIKATKEKTFFARQAPDYKHWAMQPMWSISQAIALLLDIEPRAQLSSAGSFSAVNVEKYMRSNKELITAKQYFDYYDTLYNIVLNSNNRDASRKPFFFIEWAKSNDIEVPEKLADALKQYGHNDTDWHAKSIEQTAQIERLEKEIAELKKAPASPNLDSSNATAADTDLITDKNKSTLLWLLGVALHKAWPRGFANDDKGNTLATNILAHVSTNNLFPKVQQAAVAKAVVESREAVVLAISEIADNAIVSAKAKTKV